MSAKKPKVIVTRKLPGSVETRLCELFETRLNENDEPFSKERLSEAMRDAEVLIPTVTDKIDKGLLTKASDKLRLIANFGNGFDNIDMETANLRGITVTNTPNVLTEDTADFAMALMLAVPRRISEGLAAVQDGTWQGWSPNYMLGHRIWGKRLGILGLGRIGRAVAKRAKAFGLQIHYHNRRRAPIEVEEALEATYWESLDQMLARVDILTVHCPHTPATFHLLSARRLALLAPHAYVINCARGEVLDEAALGRLIKAEKISGAGLDVFEQEPQVNKNLRESKRVLLLPHMGSATIEARQEMGERVIINIKTFMDGHRPPDKVLPSNL